MSKVPSYDTVNKAFEKAVVLLQENLQYLANSGKVSDKFISMQNNIIKAIIDYQHQTEQIIGHLEWENWGLAKGKVNEIEKLKLIKESLEAVCIIHGIMDFPMWMNKGNRYLVHQAVEDYRNDTITLPCVLKEKFDELPEDEKEVLDRILYKKHYERIAELERQIEYYKRKKNDTTT